MLVGPRALVARGGDARGARGRLPRLPAGRRARTRSSPATSRWTCSRSASGARWSSRICRVPACSGPGPRGSTTRSRPGTRGTARGPGRARSRCPRTSRPARPGSCTATTCPRRRTSDRAGASPSARLGAAAGSRTTGLQHVTIAPGKHGWPRHCHASDEELFVILGGSGTVRIGDEEAAVRAGHVISRPAGTRLAHSFRAGDRRTRVPRLRPAQQRRHHVLPGLGQGRALGRRRDRPHRAARLLARRGRPGSEPRLRAWAPRSMRATMAPSPPTATIPSASARRAPTAARAGAAGVCARSSWRCWPSRLRWPAPASRARSTRRGRCRSTRRPTPGRPSSRSGSRACRSRCSAGAPRAAPGSRVSACRAGSPIRPSRSRSARWWRRSSCGVSWPLCAPGRTAGGCR